MFTFALFYMYILLVIFPNQIFQLQYSEKWQSG